MTEEADEGADKKTHFGNTLTIALILYVISCYYVPR